MRTETDIRVNDGWTPSDVSATHSGGHDRCCPSHSTVGAPAPRTEAGANPKHALPEGAAEGHFYGSNGKTAQPSWDKGEFAPSHSGDPRVHTTWCRACDDTCVSGLEQRADLGETRRGDEELPCDRCPTCTGCGYPLSHHPELVPAELVRLDGDLYAAECLAAIDERAAIRRDALRFEAA